MSQTSDGSSSQPVGTVKQYKETQAEPPDLRPTADDPSYSMQPLGLTKADRESMVTSPFYLLRKADDKFEVLNVNASDAFKAAAASGEYTEQFARWYAKQEAEREELTKLVMRSSYANRAEIEAEVKLKGADARLKQLWERWERTPLISHVVEAGLTMRRNRERAVADEKERARNQQLAVQMDVDRSI